jgi:hypothetical protein
MLGVVMLSVVSPYSGLWGCIHKTSNDRLTIILILNKTTLKRPLHFINKTLLSKILVLSMYM